MARDKSEPREAQAGQDLKLLKAIVILMAEALSQVEDGPKPEVLLQRAGLTNAEISELVGKTPDAVRMSLKRSETKAT